jgi:5-methylcytosine-specific restriction endonuclease McrA
VPLTRGGPDTLDNCQVVCRKCNRAKSDRVDISVRFETERVW